MEEKILYRTLITLTINDMDKVDVSNVNYGIPSESEYEFKDYKDLRNKCPKYFPLCRLRVKKIPFRRKFTDYVEFQDTKITEKNFKKASIKISYLPENDEHTLEYLMHSMTTNDFFEYCKDKQEKI